MTRSQGFTLIEMMVTVVVLAIAVSVAVPGFASVIRHTRASSDVNAFTTALAVARAEAIKRNGMVCVTSDSWASGWQVRYVSDRSMDCSTATTLLRAFDATQKGSGLTVKIGSSSAIALAFLGTGARSSSSAYNISYRSVSGTCDPKNDRDITVAATGRPIVVSCAP